MREESVACAASAFFSPLPMKYPPQEEKIDALRSDLGLEQGAGDVCTSISPLNGPRFVALIYMEAQNQAQDGNKSRATLGVISGLYSTIVLSL